MTPDSVHVPLFPVFERASGRSCRTLGWRRGDCVTVRPKVNSKSAGALNFDKGAFSNARPRTGRPFGRPPAFAGRYRPTTKSFAAGPPGKSPPRIAIGDRPTLSGLVGSYLEVAILSNQNRSVVQDIESHLVEERPRAAPWRCGHGDRFVDRLYV